MTENSLVVFDDLEKEPTIRLDPRQVFKPNELGFFAVALTPEHLTIGIGPELYLISRQSLRETAQYIDLRDLEGVDEPVCATKLHWSFDQTFVVSAIGSSSLDGYLIEVDWITRDRRILKRFSSELTSYFVGDHLTEQPLSILGLGIGVEGFRPLSISFQDGISVKAMEGQLHLLNNYDVEKEYYVPTQVRGQGNNKAPNLTLTDLDLLSFSQFTLAHEGRLVLPTMRDSEIILQLYELDEQGDLSFIADAVSMDPGSATEFAAREMYSKVTRAVGISFE